MRILTKSINAKTGEGVLKVQPEEEEDMYHLYNLLCAGDELTASTVRNITTEKQGGSSSSSREKSRVHTRICIRVETIEFDEEQCSLRVKGVNVRENEYVKLGQYHTIEVELNRTAEISKDSWDSVHLDLIEDFSDPSRKADVVAVVMHEGLAHVCLLKDALTKVCARIERSFPKKKDSQAHAAALLKFFDDIYAAIQRSVDFDVVKVVLVGSPAFLNQDFLQYVFDRAVRNEDTTIIKNKSKFLRAHCSSGHKRSIEEMLAGPDVMAQLGEVKAANEIKALKIFHEMLASDPDRACYGLEQVSAANEQLAIADLLITDRMFRSSNYEVRKKYVRLIESVRESGGRVFQFSSMHPSGTQLNLYTGIAATLRFPIPDAAVSDADSSSDDDEPLSGMINNTDADLSAFI